MTLASGNRRPRPLSVCRLDGRLQALPDRRRCAIDVAREMGGHARARRSGVTDLPLPVNSA